MVVLGSSLNSKRSLHSVQPAPISDRQFWTRDSAVVQTSCVHPRKVCASEVILLPRVRRSSKMHDNPKRLRDAVLRRDDREVEVAPAGEVRPSETPLAEGKEAVSTDPYPI